MGKKVFTPGECLRGQHEVTLPDRLSADGSYWCATVPRSGLSPGTVARTASWARVVPAVGPAEIAAATSPLNSS